MRTQPYEGALHCHLLFEALPDDATRHPSDGRMTIPTAELEAVATDDEKRPKSALYPRDPTLDPRLVRPIR